MINIVAGGPIEDLPDLAKYQSSEDIIWLGVDSGAINLIEAGIKPYYACGDFDSVTEKELNIIKESVGHIDIYNSEKNETDLEIGLNWAVSQNCKKINLFGVTGGRLDHTIANLYLIKNYFENYPEVEFKIIDRQNELFFKKPGNYKLYFNEEKPYVTFLSLTEQIHGLHLSGFKYEVANTSLKIGSTLGVSNEINCKTGHYSFQSGILVVIRSVD